MPKRGNAWDEEETLYLLSAIDEFLPINPEEWEQVNALHDQRYALIVDAAHRQDTHARLWGACSNYRAGR